MILAAPLPTFSRLRDAVSPQGGAVLFIRGDLGIGIAMKRARGRTPRGIERDLNLTPAAQKSLTTLIRNIRAKSLKERLQKLENEAHEIGAHVTARGINRAKNALGWEEAGRPDKAAEAINGDV